MEVELPAHRGGQSQRGRDVIRFGFVVFGGVRGTHQSDAHAIEFSVGFTHPTSRLSDLGWLPQLW
jgi:hypothetical protein